MDLRRASLLILTGILLFLILCADVQAAGDAAGGPCGNTVTARRGDTMTSIARRCGVAPTTLASSNRLRPTSPLGVGQTLVMPDSQAPAPVPTRAPIRPTRSYASP